MIEPRPPHRRSTRLGRLYSRLLPVRHVVIRSDKGTSVVRLGRLLQLLAFMLFTVAVAWTMLASQGYLILRDQMVRLDHELVDTRQAYRKLLDEVATYQQRIGAIVLGLNDERTVLRGLVEQNRELKQNLEAVEAELRSTRQERETMRAARERLLDQLAQIESRIRVLQDGAETATGDAFADDGPRAAAAAVAGDLDHASRVETAIQDLEGQIAALQSSRREVLRRIHEETASHVSALERVIDRAGLDVDRLLASSRATASGQGGPFIEAGAALRAPLAPGAELASLNAQLSRWEALRELIRRLPLAPPLDAFSVSSPFGERSDPINGRPAIHEGLDLAAPMRSPVYATAPGRVVHAGWLGRYGRLVVVDHGAGVTTRYGHLAKILVKKGDEVEFGDEVGLLGNSGRSTGAHLHYEVRYNREPKDPMTFIKAGRHVFQN